MHSAQRRDRREESRCRKRRAREEVPALKVRPRPRRTAPVRQPGSPPPTARRKAEPRPQREHATAGGTREPEAERSVPRSGCGPVRRPWRLTRVLGAKGFPDLATCATPIYVFAAPIE